MFGITPIYPDAGGGVGGGGPPTSYYRDLVWVDLHVAPGGSGNETNPLNTANLGLVAVPDGGTLILMGGDASTEAGVNIGARSLNAFGFSGQKVSGGQTPKLPTLTYAITTGTQRCAFRNISVALVHSGTASSLSEFYFEFCPTVTLTAGGDASPVYWVGAPGNTFSGSGGAAQFIGGTIAGYVANGGGAVSASGSNITSDITSSSSIVLTGSCTFGGALSITAPSISVDLASYANAITAGVSFSSTVNVLVVFGTPTDIGTANAPGTSPQLVHADHVHKLPFGPVQSALGGATGVVSFNGQRISNVGAPTSGGDAVNKTYADAIAVGLKPKTAAAAVATANQATMSGTAQTIDGVALNTIGMRVLLTGQTTATQNGLWVIASGAWTRPADFATGSGAAQSYVPVTGGTLWAGSSYVDTNTVGSDVVDTNNLTWTLFNPPVSITAGAGLTKTGTTIDVVAGDATIVVHADDIVVGVIGNANLADNTIALARLVNATAQGDFLMRKSSGAGPWERGSVTDAQAALGIVAGGTLKSVRAATTANITLTGTQTVDGVALVAGDRCLVKNQTTASQNGVYVVAAGAWARAADASSAGQLFAGLLVPIGPEGTATPKRVAMLTTADPITIGTTSLTFAMDRIVPVASVAPQDITTGAAQIGTAVDGARADHVHTLTFLVAAAALALASTSISVNNQKITSLATPTISTDAANKGYVDSVFSTAIGTTVAPLNPGDNGKIVYASGGALAYAANIKTDATRFQFGVTGTGGLLNFAQSSNIAFGANNAGTQVVPLFRWGSPSPVSLVDGIYIGSTSGDAGKVANMRFGVDTGGAFQWEVNGAAAGSLSAFGQTVTPVATTGAPIAAFRVTDAAHTALTASTERHSVLFDLGQTRQWATGALTNERAMRVIAPTFSFVGASTITTAATVAISGAPAAGTNATITNSLALWLEGGGIGLGATPARSGDARFSGNTFANWRNLSGTPNTLDLKGIGYDGSDNLIVGDNTNGTALYLDCKTGGTVNVRVGSSAYNFSTNTLAMNGQAITFGGAPSAGGVVRLSNNTDVRARNVLGTGDITLIRSDASDNVLVGATGAGGDLYHDVASGKTQWFRFNGGTPDYRLTSTFFDLTDNYAQWTTASAGSSAVSSIGLQRFTGSPGVIIGARNFDNTGDIGVISLSGDGTTFNDLRAGDDSAKGNNALYMQAHSFAVVRLNGANEFVYFTTYLDCTDNQIRFGSNPSTNALINTSYSASGTSILAAKDSGGTARNLIGMTSLDIAQFGSGLITTQVIGQGNTWQFGTTASFPGVAHNLAAGATVNFGTASSNGVINFSGASAVLIGAKNISSTDRALFTWGSTDVVTLGSSAITTIVTASGGNWQFGSTASFPGVGHNIAAGGFLSFGSAPALTGTIRVANNVAAITARNGAGVGDVDLFHLNTSNQLTFDAQLLLDTAGAGVPLRISHNNIIQGITTTAGTANLVDWGNTANNTLSLGDTGTVKVIIGGAGAAVSLGGAASGVAFYGAAGSSKLTVSGSRSGNVALASLLSSLATLGLITNSTTP